MEQTGARQRYCGWCKKRTPDLEEPGWLKIVRQTHERGRTRQEWFCSDTCLEASVLVKLELASEQHEEEVRKRAMERGAVESTLVEPAESTPR